MEILRLKTTLDRRRMMHTRNPNVETIWNLLAPYIASENPPDLGNEEQAELLTSNVLPTVWDLMLAVEKELNSVKQALSEIYHICEHEYPDLLDI